MKEEAIPREARHAGAPTESAGDVTRSRKRRRTHLRHETAAVVAEIRRMRRAHWSDTGDVLSGRLAS